MKLISETAALIKLKNIKEELRTEITGHFEHRARGCQTCKTPGACCLDEHFVNVHISRLEAAAINRALLCLPSERQMDITERIARTVEKYGLGDESDTFSKTYACPLFEKGVGCLVHNEGKPVPCIVHACYESAAHLPPDEMQILAELRIAALNKQTYGRKQQYLSIPVALRQSA